MENVCKICCQYQGVRGGVGAAVIVLYIHTFRQFFGPLRVLTIESC